MTFGYLATWLSFGTNLSLIAIENYVDLSKLHWGLLPFAMVDCVLICVQFAMIVREASWFLETPRTKLIHMEQGHPLSTLVNSISLLAIAIAMLQITKIMVIGTHWPLSNDATTAFGLISAMCVLCNTIICLIYSHNNTCYKLDVARGTAALVLLSMASLFTWGSIGSSTLMMDLETKESYQILFELDVVTGLVQIIGIALIQYLAHNLHTVK